MLKSLGAWFFRLHGCVVVQRRLLVLQIKVGNLRFNSSTSVNKIGFIKFFRSADAGGSSAVVIALVTVIVLIIVGVVILVVIMKRQQVGSSAVVIALVVLSLFLSS